MCWWTVMNAVVEHGSPLVDDPNHIGVVDSTRARAPEVATGRNSRREGVLPRVTARSYARAMSDLHTKNGRPLRVSGNRVFSRSGQEVGRIRGRKVFGPDGRYVGTIAGGRLVYRSTDSASVGSLFVASSRAGSAQANRVGSAIWGEEPPIPD